MAGKSAIAADFVPHCHPLSLCFSNTSLTLFTVITQIGFPGDEGTREEKGVTGGP